MKFFRHCLLFVLLIGWLIQPVDAVKVPELVTFAPPTNFSLDDNEIAENSEIGDPVGTFSATDPEGGTTFTYALTTTGGANDNASFQIQGNELQANAAFDFEVKNTYQIEVTVTDAQSETTVSTFTINITDANEAPTDIELNGTNVAEDAAIGTTVGTLSTVDPDGSDTFTYELVDGEANNDEFDIIGNEIQTAVAFDIEADEARQVLVQTSDAGGETFEETFTITITNVDAPNQPPTDITLTNATVDENQEVGTLIGTLNAVDAEDGPDATFAFELVDGAADNNQFSIVGNELRSAAVFDFETKASYEVRIRTADSEGEAFEKTLAITVTNVNEPPTDIALIGNAVSENAPVGTTVGLLSTVDPDASDVFTYALVDGAGGTNNDQFTIEGNELRTAVAFAVEADETREVRIRTTDAAGESFENAFTIDITNADVPNQPPTDIALSNASIAENQPELTFIGRLSTTDADDTEGFVYEKTGGDGSANNASFRVKGDSLLSQEVFDFETQSSYQVRIQTTDPQGASFARSFTIDVTDVDENTNQPPTDVTLSSESIAENQPSGSLVGNLSTVDLDSDDSFTYTLTDGEGDADNASFRIQDDRLLTETAFDFETKQQYQVRITTTDADGASFTKAFTIQVTDINEDTNQAPTDLILSSNTIAENEPFNSEVGRFTVEDPDASDSHTITLVEGEGDDDNGRFQIRNNILYSLVSFDFEERSTYSIRVQGRDPQQATVVEIFTISVTDVTDNDNQAPTDIILSNTQVSEGQIVNLVVGTFSAEDADPSDTHTFTLVPGEGDDDNAIFSIADKQLQTAQVFNFNTQARYRIRVRADDGRGGTVEKSLTITVTEGENNAPIVANPIPDLSTAVGQTFSYVLPDNTFTDADAADVLSYAVSLSDATPVPEWLTFDNNTLILSGVPPEDSPDSLVLSVTATDSRGASVSDEFTLAITRVTAVDDEVSATWTVYPVPTDQRLVTVEAPLEHGLAIQFRLLDTSGRLVKRYPMSTMPSVRYVLPLPEALSTGAYFLEIRTSDHTIRKRIMLR